MTQPKYSVYEYLTFVIPGGVILAATIYGWKGWPFGEPGVIAAAGLVVAAFISGHALASVANWLEPMWWRRRPGSTVSSSAGLFGEGGLYDADEEKTLRNLFRKAFPELSGFENQWRAAYSVALRGPLGSRLQIMVDQIGFYRSMAAASLLCGLLILAFELGGKAHLPLLPWLPITAVTTLAFALRYRRFWTRLGDYVVREVVVAKRDE